MIAPSAYPVPARISPSGPPLPERLRGSLEAAVRYCIETQTTAGSWGVQPAARMFDTGAVAFALTRLPQGPAVAAAVGKAGAWLARASAQSHHSLARLMEEVPWRLITQRGEAVDLRDPSYFTPLFRRKALLVYAMAQLGGCPVLAPLSLDDVRAALRAYVGERERTVTKRWGRADLLALHVVLESVGGPSEAARAGVALLQDLQSETGEFVHNPISTAFACMALAAAAPGSTALERCVERLLESQHADGTWRYFETDVWDTSLMVRVFGRHPLFRARCLPAAMRFLRQAQNRDGGWGFRSRLESDNDSSACTLLCFDSREPEDREVVRRGLRHLAAMQLADGLWRTWQSSEDGPAKDCVGHVIEALDRFEGEHDVATSVARGWLHDRLTAGGDPFARWRADWYHSVPYGVFELSRALPRGDVLRRAGQGVLDELRRPDGGYGGTPGSTSCPLDTGLALAARVRQRNELDQASVDALDYLVRAQTAEGTWAGRPCMVGPRPLLIDMQTNTHAFAAWGLMEASRLPGL